MKKTIILDKTSSQREDLLVCLVLCLVVAIFLERTKRIGTDSDWLALRTYMTSHNWLILTSHVPHGGGNEGGRSLLQATETLPEDLLNV